MALPQNLAELFRYSDIPVTVLNNALVLSTSPLVFTQIPEAPIPISANLIDNTIGSFTGDVYTLLTNSAPSQGVATITAAGLFTYTPITPMTSGVTITYKVCRAINPLTCSTNTIQINLSFNNLCPLENVDDTVWNFKVFSPGFDPIIAANTFEGTGFPRISNLGSNSGGGYSVIPNVPKLNKIRWVVGQNTFVLGGVNWHLPTAVGATNQFVAITAGPSGSNQAAPLEYRLTLKDSNGTGKVYSLGIISPNDLIELEHDSIINSSAINTSVSVKINGIPFILGDDLGIGMGFNSSGLTLTFNSRSNIGCFLAMDSSWLMYVTNTPGLPTDLARQTLNGSVFPSIPLATSFNTAATLRIATPSYATDRIEFGVRSGYSTGILYQWVPTGTAPFSVTVYVVSNTLGVVYYNGSGFSVVSYTLPNLAGNWVILRQVTGAPLVFRDNVQLTADSATVTNSATTNYGFHWDRGLAYYRHK